MPELGHPYHSWVMITQAGNVCYWRCGCGATVVTFDGKG